MYTNTVADPLLMVPISHQIKYRQMYEQEMKGKASTEAAVAEAVHAGENAETFSQVRSVVPLFYTKEDTVFVF